MWDRIAAWLARVLGRILSAKDQADQAESERIHEAVKKENAEARSKPR